MDIPADVKRVFEDDAANFTGERLKKGQISLCRNVPVPGKGWELFWRDIDTGVYYSHSLEVDTTDYSAVALVQAGATAGQIQALINLGKTVFVVDSTTGDAVIPASTYQLLAHTYHFIGGFGGNSLKINGNVTLTGSATAGNQSIVFSGQLDMANASTLTVTDVTADVTVEKLVVSGAVANVSIEPDLFIETLDVSPANGFLTESIVMTTKYQLLESVAGNGGIKNSSAVDVTADRQEYWKRPIDPNIANKKPFELGYVNPEGLASSFDTPTRTYTITHSSGTVEFWTEGTHFEIPNGDPRLSYQLPDLNQLNYLTYDATGALTGKNYVDWDDAKTRNLSSIVGWDKDAGEEILTIHRGSYADANHRENWASYRSKGLQPTDSRLAMTGVVGGTQTGYSDAEYLTARDFPFTIEATAATAKAWPIYYYDGADDSANYRVKRFLSLPPTGVPFVRDTDIGIGATGNLVYNIYTPGTDTFSLGVAASNQYIIGHIAVGEGANATVVALMPQGVYGSESAARDAIETEVEKLILTRELFHDVGIVASFICKGDTGAFQDATGTGGAFVIPKLGVTGGGGVGTVVPSLASVMNVANSANGLTIEDLADPVNPQDAVTKSYHDKVYTNPLEPLALTGDPSSNIHGATLFGSITGTSKWYGGVLTPQGKIIGIPFNSTQVLEIDPVAQTTTLFGSLTGTAKWYGGVLTPQGKIIGIPSNSTQVLEIDPVAQTTTLFGSLTGTAKWIGGVLTPQGKIIGIPFNSTQVLEIDPVAQTTTLFGSLTGTSKWFGGVLTPQGKIIGIPSNSTQVLEIHNGGYGNNWWALSNYVNKF
jgi:hypothetical protein